MNIFFLDRDIKKCAQYHCDKHCVKMILESVQLLCTAHHATGGSAPYKKSHINHPCSIWVRECIENYIWLCDLGLELCKEYTHRYGKRHKSQDIIEWCLIHKPNIKEIGDITSFALAMPDECKIGNAVESYREYYLKYKKDFSKWTNRDLPYWFIVKDESLVHHQ